MRLEDIDREIVPIPPSCIEGVIFDLDGVLVDAAGWHKDAFNASLESYGYEPLSNEEHYKTFNGLSSYKKYGILADQCRIPKSQEVWDSLYNAKQKLTIELINANCSPITRVIDVVEYAKSLYGPDRIAVATNCSRATAELMLEKSNLLNRLNIIITNEDVGDKVKPHPLSFLKARDAMDLSNGIKNILAIDDTEKGCVAAVDALCRIWHLRRFEDLTVRNLLGVFRSASISI